MSTPMAFRPDRSAAFGTTPEPDIGSKITSPGFEIALTAASATSIGMRAGKGCGNGFMPGRASPRMATIWPILAMGSDVLTRSAPTISTKYGELATAPICALAGQLPSSNSDTIARFPTRSLDCRNPVVALLPAFNIASYSPVFHRNIC